MDSKTKPSTAAFILKNISKSFGQVRALDDVSFEIPMSCTFGLIGPNGAGKTTTFSLLAGYLAPASGNILALGLDPRNVDHLRGRIGVLPQDARLPSDDTVGEFLVFVAQLQQMTSSHAINAARTTLAEFGGADWWDTPCATLSHGMAKRVALAQAFLGNPEIVLLDEPTAGLDPRVAQQVRDILQQRAQNATLVISSHNLQEIETLCQYAAILDRGKLIACGSMLELTSSTSVLRFELAADSLPNLELQTIPGVVKFLFEPRSRELVVQFEPQACDAEEMLKRVALFLFERSIRISAINKGRRLERSILELTR